MNETQPAAAFTCVDNRMPPLLVALAGTSYAAIQLPANSVGAKQLKQSAVISAKVRNNALTGVDIKESTLKNVYATQAENADSADTLDEFHAGDLLGIAGYQLTTGTSVKITEDDSVISATATCPAGKVAMGGGASLADDGSSGGIRLAQSYPTAVGTAYGWRVTVVNNWYETTSLTPYVVCATQLTGYATQLEPNQ